MTDPIDSPEYETLREGRGVWGGEGERENRIVVSV